MTPIVNGLEEQYDGEVVFLRLNARDNGDGARAFQAVRLPGHPSFLLLRTNGVEVWRGFGVVDAATIEVVIQSILE